jgi:hypothetical protein
MWTDAAEVTGIDARNFLRLVAVGLRSPLMHGCGSRATAKLAPFTTRRGSATPARVTSKPTSGTRPLLHTVTGEPFVPVRLYWSVKSKPAITKALASLCCIDEDKKAKCWVWLYDDEATSLTFGIPRARLSPEVHPIVIGRFRLPDAKQLVLEVRSVERAIEAAKFFAPRFGSNAVLSRARIINRWFELSEAGIGLERLDKLLDANVVRIDPRDAEEAFERAMAGTVTEAEKRRAFEAYVLEQRKRDVPLVEDFPLAPEEETPDFRDLTMTLQFRGLRAEEHWKGNTSVTLGDVIYRLAGAQSSHEMIDDEAAATRLANAILSDVALYNEARIRAATNVRIALASEFGEARDLFASRVVPHLHPVFESALDQFLAAREARAGGVPGAAREPDYVQGELTGDDRDTSGPGRLLLFSAVVMVVGLGIVWWLMQRAG